MDAASEFRGYELATLCCILALAAALAAGAPAPCFVLAVVVSSLYGGKGPGPWCAALSAFADACFPSPHTHLFVGPSFMVQLGTGSRSGARPRVC